MKRHLLYLLMLCTAIIITTDSNAKASSDDNRPAKTIDLSGEWQFAMGDSPAYTDAITLPGSMLTNGKGNAVSVNTQWTGSLYDSSFYFNPAMEKYRVEGQMKFPFFLTPDKHYTGNAWYKRTVDIPKEWRKKRVMLHLERPHIESTVFVNGRLAGRDSSLCVPHEFDITEYVNAGKQNTIEVKVYNGIENVCVGQDSHSVTDQTQGNWNGIAGDIFLEALPLIYIKDIQLYPNIKTNEVEIRTVLTGSKEMATKQFANKDILFEILDSDGKVVSSRNMSVKELASDDRQKKTTSTYRVAPRLHIKDAKLWDEFTPNLYTARVSFNGHNVEETFGMREISIEGHQFYINGRPTWMRGTLDCCCFPMTGYAPTDEAEWIRIFEKCKEYGLNHIRFHSYCPPEAAFAAADKVGMYLQPEGPSWPNHGVRLNRGMSIDRYLMEETVRMVEQYGNHPSFTMLAAGNEPAGDWVTWVGKFVDDWKATGDRRRVYCGASVGGGWAFDPKSEFHVKGGAKGLNWNNAIPQSDDIFDKNVTSFLQKGRKPILFDITNPLICHEQGQWCAFPDLKEGSQYTGAYKAGNLDIFADLLERGGMASQAEKFLMASGRLQTLAYKYELERNLRTPEYAGFQLLGLNDYSGQGSALVGVLNVFWREKGYCTANDWTQFCSPIVPLARFPRFVFTDKDVIKVPVELYNAYSEPLKNATVRWKILDASEKTVVKDGMLPAGNGTALRSILPLGKNIDLGTITIHSAPTTAPVKQTLVVYLTTDNAKEIRIENSWDFWIYPSEVQMPVSDGIYITNTLDAKALATLNAGGKVLIEAAGKVTLGSDIKQTYLPVFWNTSWFKMRPPHTTGATIDTTHPLFRHGFATDDWGNLNWWELLNRAQVMNLRELPASYQPPVQPIDTWHVSRKLGMLIEANVGGGKLLMTTMDISTDLDKRIVARQMRSAILSYMQSTDFNPSLSLSAETIDHFFTTMAPAVNMFTKDSPDELKPKLK